MPDLNQVLFSAVSRASRPFSRAGLGRIPGVKRAYHLLDELVWWVSKKSVIGVQGSRMYVNVFDKDPSMRNTFRAYAQRRVHEEATTTLFKQVVKEGDVVLDLGANIGYFSLLAARLVGESGKVYCFEPEPRNYGYLMKNVELNGYRNVVAINKAVSNKTGKTRLYLCSYDTGHHTINQDRGITTGRSDVADGETSFVEVETVVLDEFLPDTDRAFDVIKMDVEGAELLALSGMDRLIRENKNLKMFIEFYPRLIREMGSSPEEFIRRLLEDYHFPMRVIGHDYSMSGYSSGKEYLEIDSVEGLMNLCQGETDHVNLFLQKTS